jgi:hypothetical protein
MDNKNNSNEPIVLGTLKKEKASKPAVVILCFILILGTCFGLPYIKDYLSKEDNPITEFYKKYFGKYTDDADNTGTTTKPVTSDDLHILNNLTNITYQNITLTNVSFSGNEITYYLASTSDNYNLDNNNLFIEIYGSANNLLTRINLSGTLNQTPKSYTSKLYKLGVNSSENYYGKIAKVSLDKYPSFNLINNTLTCTSTNNTYIYKFTNDKLVNINETYNYFYDQSKINLDTYMNELNISKAKSTKIASYTNSSSTTSETDTGFAFTASLDLNNLKVSDLGEYYESSYYDLNTSSKQVNYEMLTKGYDCK